MAFVFNPFRNKPWTRDYKSFFFFKFDFSYTLMYQWDFKVWAQIQLSMISSFISTDPGFYVSAVQDFCKHCGKRCFLPIWRICYHFLKFENCHQQTLSVWKSLKFVFWETVNRVENILGKGENAGNQHFLLFPKCFIRCNLPQGRGN